MTSEDSVRLCERAFELDEEFEVVYKDSFPKKEKESVPDLKAAVVGGTTLYHRTRNAENALLCFSLLTPTPEFDFLAYIATNQFLRSSGIGSKHLGALNELKPSDVLAFEIEATEPRFTVLTAEQIEERRRREAFYLRNGARRILKNKLYLLPNMHVPGESVEAEVWVFAPPTTEKQEEELVRGIYKYIYKLPDTDPLVARVLAQFDVPGCPCGSTCGSGDTPKCPGGAACGSSDASECGSVCGGGNDSAPLANETPSATAGCSMRGIGQRVRSWLKSLLSGN